tara:strand:+ start:1876 stop:2238 length:363 start_codon:yes stop_codon:yes gene_type:complete
MKKITLYEYITYISLVVLILIIAIWNSLISPSPNLPRIIPTLIYNAPLLVLMIKLKRNKFSTYIMTSYVMLLYFVVGVGNTTSEHTFNLGIIISILSLVIFVSSIFYVREKNNKSANDSV